MWHGDSQLDRGAWFVGEPAFWVPGLAALLLALTFQLIPLQGESREWALFFVLGSGLPALIFGATVLNTSTTRSFVPVVLMRLLGIFFLSTCIVLLGDRVSVVFTLAAIGQILLLRLFSAHQGEANSGWLRLLPKDISLFLLSSIAWLACGKLIWWEDANTWILSGYGMSVFLVAFSLAMTLTHGHIPLSPPRRILGTRVVDFLAAGLLLLASSRTTLDFHDVSFVAGAIDLVKQGGWLLWDVPSQYGFLNIQLAAQMPSNDGWTSLYILSSALLFASAWVVYSVLNKLGSGAVHRVASLAVTLASVLMLPGWAPRLAGANYSPVASAFRFIWVYLLLWILLRASQLMRKSPAMSAPLNWILFAGTMSWILGTLWSVESAIYCGLIWLPSSALLVFNSVWTTAEQKFTSSFQWVVAFLLFNFGLLAGGIAGISIYYHARIGATPDWIGFVEYALAYQAGFGSLPISSHGAVWWLVLGFSGIVAAIVTVWKHDRLGLPLVIGAMTAVWSTHSYFIARSHENNITNLTPIMLVALALVLGVLKRCSRRDSIPLAMLMVPFITMVQFAAYGNIAMMPGYMASLFEERSLLNVVEHLPYLPQDLRDIFQRAGVKESDPMAFVGNTTLFRRSTISPIYWLPVAPATQLAILEKDRQEIYLSRFSSREFFGGWLVQPRILANSVTGTLVTNGGERLVNPALLESFQAAFVRKKSLENAYWRIEWYERNRIN